MQSFQATIRIVAAVLTVSLCQLASAQDTANKDAQSHVAKGLPPRATPGDYLAHAQAGNFTIAAEFAGHSVPTQEALLSTEDYVVVEVGMFGPPEARLKLTYADFSLRLNKKKTVLPAQPYTFVFKSLKDPDWTPPDAAEAKSKTSIGGGGAGEDNTPKVVHIPLPLERAMEQRVQNAVLPEAEHVLPGAGLIFFQYRGKTDNLNSIDLIYDGPAGKVTLPLHP
ncbi:MAG: hypothetical protein ABSB35_10550 [Bryobacteraceae bacterium]|jgi:hypothetical protein